MGGGLQVNGGLGSGLGGGFRGRGGDGKAGHGDDGENGGEKLHFEGVKGGWCFWWKLVLMVMMVMRNCERKGGAGRGDLYFFCWYIKAFRYHTVYSSNSRFRFCPRSPRDWSLAGD